MQYIQEYMLNVRVITYYKEKLVYNNSIYLNISKQMSYKAQIQFCIHLHSFKNIQIDRQGFAAIRFQIFDQSSSSNINYALPYNIVPYYKHLKHIHEEMIDDNGYQSSTVRIQYQDEKYILNNIIQFKLLIESLPKLCSSDIYLKCILLFSNLHSYPDKNQAMDPSLYGMEQILIKLDKIQTGIFHYFEEQFVDNYASSVNFTLFAMITDFKLYPYSMRAEILSESEKQKKKERDREKIVDFQDLLEWMPKHIKGCSQPLKYLVDVYAKTLRYNTYVLKTRINQFAKNKKQTLEPNLPAYYKKKQEKVTDKQLFNFFTEFDGNKVSLKQFKDDIYSLHEQNFFFVQEVVQLMSNNMFDTKKLIQQFQRYITNEAHGRMIKQIQYGHQLTNTSHAEEILSVASKIRKQQKEDDKYPIAKVEQNKSNEYLFYQICYSKDYIGMEIQKIKNEFQFSYDERNMVIVFCHGFQASSLDMRLIHRGLKQALPLAQCLVSTSNQADTEIDINQMGQKLAKQIHRFIKLEGLDPAQVILNFVGHSMGGVIARSSLIYLPEYENRLGFFCSFSSPHLGYMSGTDGMIKTGLWFMRKMKQTKSLDQLSMADASDPRDTFLYQLSKTGRLTMFKKIILISSAEDSYVPWHSARISGYKSNRNSSKVQVEMAENIIGGSTVHRLDINFSVKKNDLDGFIGRKAHINLITNESIMKLINKVIPKLFDLRQV